MELVWALTLWGLWSFWLLAQHLRAPAAVTRVGAGLLVGELVALALHSFDCADAGCGPVGRAAGTAASVDVPLLAVVFVVLAVGQAWWRAAHEAAPRREHEPARSSSRRARDPHAHGSPDR